MRVRARGLDSQHEYPCSKVDVKVAFGDSLLESVWFGLSPAYKLDSRHAPRPKITGIVLMAISVSLSRECSLHVYQVPRAIFSEHAHSALVELMRGKIREWIIVTKALSETAVFGTDYLLVELVQGDLALHDTRFR